MTIDVDCAVPGCRPARRQHRRQRSGNARFGIRAEHEARDGDPDLAGGNVAIERGRRLEDRHQPAGEAVALLGQLADPASAGADGGEFGGHVARR